MTSFRNYESQNLEFSPGINLLIGQNGQGKTNILEAVYYLSLLRSFRTQKVVDLCNFGHDSFTIFGEVTTKGNHFSLGVTNGDERKLAVNGAPCANAANFISNFICTAFVPEDLNIVKNSPSYRRKFMDILLCQLSPEYLQALQAYNFALRQRNAILKMPEKFSKNAILAYNGLLTKNAGIIESQRKACIDKINEILIEKSKNFYDGKGIFALKYLSGCGALLKDISGDPEEIEKYYEEQLERHHEGDLQAGITRFGPHRSEFSCLLNNLQLAAFGSEGECRTATLSLKLAAIDILYGNLGKEDVTLLVDDVFGELDNEKREIFFDLLNNAGQVIMACTAIPDGLRSYDRTFRVNRGVCTQDSN